jgi:hypothetical protein
MRIDHYPPLNYIDYTYYNTFGKVVIRVSNRNIYIGISVTYFWTDSNNNKHETLFIEFNLGKSDKTVGYTDINPIKIIRFHLEFIYNKNNKKRYPDKLPTNNGMIKFSETNIYLGGLKCE